MEFGKLPVDVLRKIVSYQVGEPEYMKMKNSPGLKEIQKKYKPKTCKSETHMDYTDGDIIEKLYFEIEPKVQSMSYVLNLILKQTEYIKKIIEQSHLMYLQPDMEKDLLFYLECDYEKEFDDPLAIRKRTFNADIRTDIDDIQGALDELYEDMFDTVDSYCEEEYDKVKLHKLYFTIGIFIETED